jgi:hypothetical protein
MEAFMKNHFCWDFAFAGPKKSSTYKSKWHKRGGGAEFGVRRPLRYLSYHLDLDDNQTRRMAQLLNQLKTEREQAQLDEKRSVSALADAMSEGTPTLDEVKTILSSRIRSTEKLNDETAKAVVAISDFLDEDQKEEFINLLLTGAFSL